MCAAGLVDIDAVGRVPIMHAGTKLARFWQLTSVQLRDRIVATGLVTDAEMDEYLALHDDEDFVTMTVIILSAWGRRPI
jgi:hypothetical protein